MARGRKRRMTKLAWSGVAAGSALLAGAAVRATTQQAWKLIEDDDVPDDAARRELPWGQALAWAIGTGALAAAARLFAERGAAKAWTRVTGRRPPRK